MTNEHELARLFEAERGYLQSLATKMLGNRTDADDAVQEAWLRLARTDAAGIENLPGWLTTVTGRICLDMLRGRTARREDPLEIRFELPEPPDTGPAPESEALLAESVALALHVVLDGLNPAERVAFVLHDLFGVPFDTVSEVLDRTPEATRMLASRARRRVRVDENTESDRGAGREVVEAFFAAARSGRLEDLLAILAPDVVLHTERLVVRGAARVAGNAIMFANPEAALHPALINGTPGVVVTVDGRPLSIMAFTVRGGRIVAIDALNDAATLGRLVPSWVG